MRRLYAPLRPDLDNFLFAAVGAEIDGMPLSMISALTRLGLDPWDEAGRLSSLRKQEAVTQLARLIVRLPGSVWSALEATSLAADLIDLLPRRDGPTEPRPAGRSALKTDQIKSWMIGLILVAAALVYMLGTRGFPFGGHRPSDPAQATEAPRNPK
jgi:hypothetical protein